MMTNCGCREISHDPIEFKIQDCCRPQVHINCGPLLPNTNELDWCRLQNKVICDFKDVIKQLECGIQPDIETILEEISLLFMNSCGYNVAKKMYSTDLEEDYFLRHNNFLSEFTTQEEKDQVLLNLGIYEKVRDMITKPEVDNIIENTVNDFNQKLDTKVGFVVTIGKQYCAFASPIHYAQWIETGNNSLIIAKWLTSEYVPNKYTVAFINNEDEGGDPVTPITVDEGFSITFPEPTWNSDSTRHFVGWYSNQAYTGDHYNKGEKFIPTQGTVFYAKWVKEAKTLTFYPNYGTNQPIVINSYLGETINLQSALSREGYTFLKWGTQPDGGILYNAETEYTINDNQSFYAQWQIKQISVEFNSNESQFGDQNNIQIQTYLYNTSINDIIFPELPVRSDGRILVGWNIQSNGNGNNPSNIPDVQKLIFYAQWEYGYKYKLTTTIPTIEPSWSYSDGQQTTLKELEGWNNWKNQLNQYLVFQYNDSDDINHYFEHIDDYNSLLTNNLYSKESNSNVSEIIVFKRKTRNPLGDDNQNNRVKIK